MSSCAYLLGEPNWQQLSYLFVFVLFVALKKRIPSKMCLLSCLVWLKSVLFSLLCVFDPFFSPRMPAVNSVSEKNIFLFLFFQMIVSSTRHHGTPRLSDRKRVRKEVGFTAQCGILYSILTTSFFNLVASGHAVQSSVISGYFCRICLRRWKTVCAWQWQEDWTTDTWRFTCSQEQKSHQGKTQVIKSQGGKFVG